MNERNALSLCAGARHLVDETHAGGSAAVERRIEIRYYETHMMQARTASGDEFADGSVGSDWLEQLDQRVGGCQARDTRAVGVVEGHDRKPENIAEEGEGITQGTNGDPDMCDAGRRVRRRLGTVRHDEEGTRLY
jgi:hypothetical protein